MFQPSFTVSKLLTNYDITRKPALPIEILQHIPIPQGAHSVDLQVTDSMERVWTFQLYTQPHGNLAIPVITNGWLEFARAKRREAGDKLSIYPRQDGELQIQIERTSYVTYQGGPAFLDVESLR